MKNLVVFSLALLCCTSVANADYILEVQQNGVSLDDGINPTMGSFDIVVTDITSPQSDPSATAILSAFAEYTGNLGSVLTLGAPTPGTIVVDNGSFTVPTPTRAGATLSNTGFAPFNVAVGDVVATVPFSVEANNTGTFTFAGWAGNGGFDSASQPVVVSLSGGVTVSAVPEPSSMALLGLGAVGFVYRRRRS